MTLIRNRELAVTKVYMCTKFEVAMSTRSTQRRRLERNNVWGLNIALSHLPFPYVS